MLAELTAMQLYCMQLARLEAAGRMSDTIAGLAKLNNTRKARWVISEGRDLLGGITGTMARSAVSRSRRSRHPQTSSRAPTWQRPRTPASACRRATRAANRTASAIALAERVAWGCRLVYELGQHVPLALRLSLITKNA
jgi:alkylation response protein AidB-like acyl-CoA dehydrogenase